MPGRPRHFAEGEDMTRVRGTGARRRPRKQIRLAHRVAVDKKAAVEGTNGFSRAAARRCCVTRTFE